MYETVSKVKTDMHTLQAASSTRRDVLGVRQRSGERRQNFWERCTQKAFSAMHDTFPFFPLFERKQSMR
jgi:hypothetical protein